MRSKACSSQVHDFGHHGHGGQERLIVLPHDANRKGMVLVALVEGGQQRAGIDQQFRHAFC
jgi:hypothetical protein